MSRHLEWWWLKWVYMFMSALCCVGALPLGYWSLLFICGKFNGHGPLLESVSAYQCLAQMKKEGLGEQDKRKRGDELKRPWSFQEKAFSGNWRCDGKRSYRSVAERQWLIRRDKVERTQRNPTLHQVLESPVNGVEVGGRAPQWSCYSVEDGDGEIVMEHRKDNINHPDPEGSGH